MLLILILLLHNQFIQKQVKKNNLCRFSNFSNFKTIFGLLTKIIIIYI